jgi:type I restriction enzyme S subunit
MKGERYAAYKDSGVEWLGEVPKHWGFARVKEIAYINQKSLSDGTPLDYEFDYVDIGGVTYGTSGYSSERMTFQNAPSRAKRVVKSGDTIISTVRTYLKAITQIDRAENLIVSTGFAVLTPKKIIYKSYFSNWLMSETFIDRVSAISKGVSYPATNSTEIGDLFVFLPPLHEQTAIAAYLDTKTSQIDRQIDLLGQKAMQYGKLKQSLINETVTRGLDRTVPMKDSDVAWIGEVPKHWDVRRGKDIFEQTKNKAGLDSSLYDVLSLTLNGVIKRDLDNMKGKIPASFDSYQIANPGDLVLCLFDIDVTPRIVGYVSDLGIITSAYTVIKGKRNVDMKYFLYYYLEQNRNGSLLANSKTLRSTMTFDLFSQLLLPVPPLGEQRAIASYLDEKTAQINRIVTAINTQIDKLKDLRKALINDVVTGKIKVVSEGIAV